MSPCTDTKTIQTYWITTSHSIAQEFRIAANPWSNRITIETDSGPTLQATYTFTLHVMTPD